MKICMVHNSSDLEGGKPLLSMIEENARKVLRRDTQIGFKGLKRGLIELEDFMSSYFTLLDTMDVIDQFIEAEKEGYDAATVDCFGDPGIPEAREIVHIPVIGAAESTMLYACLLGRKFAVITPSHPKQIARVQHQIEMHGLQGRVISSPVRAISMSDEEALLRAFVDPEAFISAILETARECVRDGADVIVLGCGGYGPPCAAAGVLKIEEMDVPLLDPMTVALKTAEVAVDFEKKLGIPFTSRGGIYASPGREDVRRVRSHFGLEGA
jgi:allantoin racemase